MRGPAGDAAVVAALAAALTLIVAAPVVVAPSERLFGMETVGRHHDPFTAMAQFAGGGPPGVYLQPLTDLPGALLARLWEPVTAHNAIVLITFPLSALGAYLLARHLHLSRRAAALAGFGFAFSPFHLSHAAYHPHIAQTQWLPLYLLALWRCLDCTSIGAIALLAAAVAGVTLSNFYGGLIAAAIAPIAIAAYWVVACRHLPGAARRLATTAATLATIGAVAALSAWVVIGAADSGVLAFPREDLFRYSAKWWSFLVPPIEHPVLGAFARRVWDAAGVREGLLEQQVSLGWGVIGLGVAATAGWMFTARRIASLAAVPILVTVAFFALLCSLSPERTVWSVTVPRPSALMYAIAPMFRSYARFGVVVQLMAVLLAAAGAEMFWRSEWRGARALCGLLVLAGAAEYAVWPPAMSRDVLPTPAHRWIMRQPDPIRVLDCALLTPASQSIGWLTHTRISLSGGTFDDCGEPAVADRLAAEGYTHVLVRRTVGDEHQFEAPLAGAGLRQAAHFPEADVFAVIAPVPTVYTAAVTGFHAREHDAAWTWRWMGPAAAWRIVNRRDRTVVAFVDVEITAFHHARTLILRVNGHDAQTLVVEPRRGTRRLGPLAIPPGTHDLAFLPGEAASVAADVIGNGDPRALSFALGSWKWVVQ
jgi:hypothetical protein